jgi:hypothetical protein
MSSGSFQDIEKLEAELWEAADNLRANSKFTSRVCLPLPDVERFANANVDPKTLISGVRGQFPIP